MNYVTYFLVIVMFKLKDMVICAAETEFPVYVRPTELLASDSKQALRNVN